MLTAADLVKQVTQLSNTTKTFFWMFCAFSHVNLNCGHTHSLGFRNTSSISASWVPLAGSCMYSHLRMKGEFVTKQHRQLIAVIQEQGNRCLKPVFSYLAVRGRDMRMLSILEPGVARPNFTPLSYTRLNSTYLQDKHTKPTVDTWLLIIYDILSLHLLCLILQLITSPQQPANHKSWIFNEALSSLQAAIGFFLQYFKYGMKTDLI